MKLTIDGVQFESDTPISSIIRDLKNGINIGGDDINGNSRSFALDGDRVVIKDRLVIDPKDADTIIAPHYIEGEYLSGYTLNGNAANLMEKIGLARYVSGWGYLVQDNVIDKLGDEFTYAAAAELASPAIEAKRAAKRNTEQARQRIFDEARTSGMPVVLNSYMDECDEPDCSQDSVTVYAMPNGSTKTVRNHTY